MTDRWIALGGDDDAPAGPPPPTVRGNAARFAAALILLIAAGTILLALPFSNRPNEPTPLIDAFFTSVSAATVTGLVVVDTAEHWSLFGQIVILALVQVGGLGFMVGASLLFQILRGNPGTSLRDQLLLRDGSPALSLRQASEIGRGVVRYTLAVEAVAAVLLFVRFSADMPIADAAWKGVFLAITGFCNAGFDLQGGFQSMTAYRDSVWINLVLMAIMQAGTLGYLVVSETISVRSWRRLSLDAKFTMLINALLVAVGAIFFLGVEWNGMLTATPDASRPLVAAFQSVSARSGGFTTVDWADANPATIFTWLGLMMAGGASGSTSGGVKLATIGVLAVAVAAAVRGVDTPQAFRRRIPVTLVFQALAIVAIFMTLHFVISVVLALTEDWFGGANIPMVDLMFETMSAIGTVGLSTGITPDLTTAGKIVLCVAMICGRLGPLTLAYLLERRRSRARYRYPEETVRLG